MDAIIKEKLEKWGVSLTPEQTAKLDLFAAELLEKNSRLNLVSRNDAGNLWSRHILDALAGAPLLARLLKAGDAAADAGAGAGFPGIPLAVVLEPAAFDLWDSSLRRQMFLTCAVSRMKLKNVRALHLRIGQSGPLETGKYGAVVERAMGKLEIILPQCLNMVKAGGVFLAWQTAAQTALERPAVLEAARKAGASLDETASYRLPEENEDRSILVFRKA